MWIGRSPVEKILRKNLLELRGEIAVSSGVADVGQTKYGSIFKDIDSDLEIILDEGRERHFSHWRTDFIALGNFIMGLIVSIILSWKKDVTKQPNKSVEATA
jgi:hypothetical protein